MNSWRTMGSTQQTACPLVTLYNYLLLSRQSLNVHVILREVVVFDLNNRDSEVYYNEGITTLDQVPDFLRGIIHGTVDAQVCTGI